LAHLQRFFRHSIPSGQFSSKKNNIKNYTLNKWKFQHFCAKVGYLNCVWKGKLKEPKHGQGLFEKSETPSFRPQNGHFLHQKASSNDSLTAFFSLKLTISVQKYVIPSIFKQALIFIKNSPYNRTAKTFYKDKTA